MASLTMWLKFRQVMYNNYNDVHRVHETWPVSFPNDYDCSKLSSSSWDQLWVSLNFGPHGTSATSTESVFPNFFHAVGESRVGVFSSNWRLNNGELRGEDVGEKLKDVDSGFLLNTGEERGKKSRASELSPMPSCVAFSTGEWDEGATASVPASTSSMSACGSGEDCRGEGTEQFPAMSQHSSSHICFLLLSIGVFCSVTSPSLWYLRLSLRTDSLRGGGAFICMYSLLMKLPLRSPLICRCRTHNTYIHMYIPTYLHTYVHTYIHTYVCTYIRTYIHTYVRTYIHTYIRMYIHTYVHTYIRMYVHTYIHIALENLNTACNSIHSFPCSVPHAVNGVPRGLLHLPLLTQHPGGGWRRDTLLERDLHDRPHCSGYKGQHWSVNPRDSNRLRVMHIQ